MSSADVLDDLDELVEAVAMAAGEVDELFGSVDDGAAFEKHPLEPARNRSGSVVTGAQLARTALEFRPLSGRRNRKPAEFTLTSASSRALAQCPLAGCRCALVGRWPATSPRWSGLGPRGGRHLAVTATACLVLPVHTSFLVLRQRLLP